MLEILGSVGMLLGGLLALIGWIWLLVISFKENIIWGVVVFFFSIVGGFIFCIMNKTGWSAFILMVVGIFLSSMGMVPFMMSILETAS